jgi:hypothetical protein
VSSSRLPADWWTISPEHNAPNAGNQDWMSSHVNQAIQTIVCQDKAAVNEPLPSKVLRGYVGQSQNLKPVHPSLATATWFGARLEQNLLSVLFVQAILIRFEQSNKKTASPDLRSAYGSMARQRYGLHAHIGSAFYLTDRNSFLSTESSNKTPKTLFLARSLIERLLFICSVEPQWTEVN